MIARNEKTVKVQTEWVSIGQICDMLSIGQTAAHQLVAEWMANDGLRRWACNSRLIRYNRADIDRIVAANVARS
jgi:hypothetical protein